MSASGFLSVDVTKTAKGVQRTWGRRAFRRDQPIHRLKAISRQGSGVLARQKANMERYRYSLPGHTAAE